MSCRFTVALVLAVAACTEPADVRRMETTAAWLEYPAEVRAGAPFELRAVFYAPGCFDSQVLRVTQERYLNTVGIRAEWLVEGESSPLCLRADPGYVDTVLAVAGLPATADSIYYIVPLYPDLPPRPVAGTVLVRPTAPLNTDRVIGHGQVVGGTDIEGCAVMQPPFSAPVPVDNAPSAQWTDYVLGYFFTPTAPLCGQTRAFHVVEGL